MMEKTEFTVGEIFQFGLKKLKVVRRNKTTGLDCEDCAFYSCNCVDMNWFTGDCDSSVRSDKRDVVFVEVEEE